ncbi:6219_t:CDS:2, partial [Funneliformis geosporum]
MEDDFSKELIYLTNLTNINPENKFTQKDKIHIFSYFTKNKDQKKDAWLFLQSLQTENDKLEYLKTFITSDLNAAKPAKDEIIKFWNKLSEAQIIFLRSQDMEFEFLPTRFELKDETSLEYTLRPTVAHEFKNNKYFTQNKFVTQNILDDLLKKSDELEDNCAAILCLPDGVFFLGEEKFRSHLLIRNCYLQLTRLLKNGPSKYGCVITGTPGIGKTYFGLFLLYYIRLYYPDSTVIWHKADSQFGTSYCFFPSGEVQIGHFNCFRSIASERKNFYLVDAQVPEGCSAYTILLTSPKQDLFNNFIKPYGFTKYYMPIWDHNEIITLWNACYENIMNTRDERFTLEIVETLMGMWGPIPRSILENWDDALYNEKEFETLIHEIDLKNCMKSVNEAGMSKNSASGRLIHIHVGPNFTDKHYQFASSLVSHTLINLYEKQLGNDLRDLITCSSNQSPIASYRGNLFEDIAHKELSKGGRFRIRELKKGVNTTEIKDKEVEKLEYNWFTTMKHVREDCYNRPKSKIFETIDSFSLEKCDRTLALYQITVSMNHGIKAKGLKVFKRSKWDNSSKKFIEWDESFKLYFVVPSENFETFPWQSYRTKTNNSIKNHPQWIKEIPQYALEIRLDREQ